MPNAPTRYLARVLHVSREAERTEKIRAAMGADYDIRHAPSSDEAMSLLPTLQPEMVVVGPRLPQSEAFELFRAIRIHDSLRGTAFVFLTSRTDEDFKEKVYGTGADAVLTLPARADVVAAQLKTILERTERYRSAVPREWGTRFTTELTPDELPQAPGYETEALTRPRSVGGGDLFTWLQAQDGTFYLALSDVQGKGYQAKSFAFAYHGYVRSAIRTSIDQGNGSPAAILGLINRIATEDPALVGMFFSILLMRWDPAQHLLTYANAGHCDPLLLSPKRPGFRRTGDVPVGLTPDTAFHEEILVLAPGESVLLYTDGFTELQSAAGVMSGLEMLQSVASEAATLTELADGILAACGREQFDDDVMAFRLKRLP